jgi:hypothetical protein
MLLYLNVLIPCKTRKVTTTSTTITMIVTAANMEHLLLLIIPCVSSALWAYAAKDAHPLSFLLYVSGSSIRWLSRIAARRLGWSARTSSLPLLSLSCCYWTELECASPRIEQLTLHWQHSHCEALKHMPAEGVKDLQPGQMLFVL